MVRGIVFDLFDTLVDQNHGRLAPVMVEGRKLGATTPGLHARARDEFGVDLPAMARGAGFSETALVSTTKDLDAAVTQLYGARGPVFVDIKVTEKAAPMVLPLRDGPSIKHRFRDAVLGET